MTQAVRVALLGSTGSIGRQALDVVARFPQRVKVTSLAAHSNAELIVEQALAFGVTDVALADADAAARAKTLLTDADPRVTVRSGPEAVAELASDPEATHVLNALVGAAGLRASVNALQAGRVLALANKESLVVGGDLVMPLAGPDSLIPVDSEHSALFQCLLGEDPATVSRLWLTASGGPFRGWTREQLASVTAEQALAHPTWTMGPKITIDSSTLMNKGLEVIEAHHLFGTDYDAIAVVVHPQSCVHSMVEYADGSVKAHLGATDMRIPIQYAFSHPDRWEAPLPPVDFRALGALDFDGPDLDTFGCLALAFAAGKTGGSAPVVLNAANEVAVAAFLAGRIGFLDIERIVGESLERHDVVRLESFEHVETIDTETRIVASGLL